VTLHLSLRHRFKGFDLDVAIEAPPGVTVLFGPSGSGKTTLIHAVAGLLRPDQGRITIDGRVLVDTAARCFVAPHQRRLGYIFQEGRLFPHLSVRQNLLYGRWFQPRGRKAWRFEQVVDLLDIAPLLERRPGALSGGEKQRVAIGRALLANPRLILADEPLAALDEARKAEILPCFERLRDEGSVPILYVSHHPAEVARLATTVVALKAGRIAALGPPATVLGNAAAVGARGAASVVIARVIAHHADGLSELFTAAGPLFVARVPDAPGARLRVRIAAHDVILSTSRPEGLSALNILSGRISDIRPGEGPGALVTLDLGGEALIAHITRRSLEALRLVPGEVCHAVLKSVAVAPENIGTGCMASEPE